MFLGLIQDFDSNTATPLECYDHAWVLVKNNQFYLLSNICPHQQSKIAKCSTSTLSCPYHGLKFDLLGMGMGHDDFLEKKPVFELQNMLLSQDSNIEFPVNLSHMRLVEKRTESVKASVDVIMDVFLDIEHIPIVHPGVYDRIGIPDTSLLQYRTFDYGSVQYVPNNSVDHMHQDDVKYNLGACWMAVYPGTMIEWQPGALFVTVARNVDDQTSAVEIYKYRDSRYWEESWELNSDVWETAWTQDKELSENISGISFKNLDQLKQHHRNWINCAL
jgi:phenylpropionate dioxygenase-like ring-hydroxylating dioxygenase large terminal subunit